MFIIIQANPSFLIWRDIWGYLGGTKFSKMNTYIRSFIFS